jgi:hypothetical protein
LKILKTPKKLTSPNVLQDFFWVLAFCVVAAEGQGSHSEVARLVLVLQWTLCLIPLSSLSPPQQGLPGALLRGALNGACAQLEAALPEFRRWQKCIEKGKTDLLLLLSVPIQPLFVSINLWVIIKSYKYTYRNTKPYS